MWNMVWFDNIVALYSWIYFAYNAVLIYRVTNWFAANSGQFQAQ